MRGTKSTRQTKMERDVFRQPPIVLNKWPEDLPAAARCGTLESLIVNGQARQTKEEIRFRVASPRATQGPEPVLEALGLHVHLIGADADADFNVVLAADHVQGVVDGNYVGSPLEWGEATIPNAEIRAQNVSNGQP